MPQEVTLSRQELYDLIWSQPFSTLSQQYQISDVGLRKMCLRLQIPLPQMGHWQRVQAGQKVDKAPLSDNSSGEAHVTLVIRQPTTAGAPVSQVTLETLKAEISQDKRLRLKVPGRLTDADPLVEQARKRLEGKQYFYSLSIYTTMYHTGEGHLSIRVSSMAMAGRALRFMDTLIKALQTRGHKLTTDNRGTHVIIGEQSLTVECREKTTRVAGQEDDWNYSGMKTNGLLSFRLEGRHPAEWKDSKEPLEAQLIRIIAKLELQALLDQQEDEKIKAYWQAQREKQQAIEQVAKQREQELTSFKNLLEQANPWKQAQVLREYLDSFSSDLPQSMLSKEKTDWLAWAKKKANWYDPKVEAEDKMLNGVDRNTLEPQVKQGGC